MAKKQPEPSEPQPIDAEELKRLCSIDPQLNAERESVDHASQQIAVHQQQRDWHAEQAKLWEGRRYERQDRFQQALTVAVARDRAGQSNQEQAPARETKEIADLEQERTKRAEAAQARRTAEQAKREKAKAARQARAAAREVEGKGS